MDQLKTLRSFSWSAVERQAEEVFKSVRSAQSDGLTSTEYFGVIHAVNVEILRANGFTLTVNYNPPNGPRSVTISWSPFFDVRKEAELEWDESSEGEDDSDSDDDEEEECCPKTCCPCGPSPSLNSNNNDHLKNLVASILSSLADNKK